MKIMLLLPWCLLVGGCVSPAFKPPTPSTPPLPSSAVRKSAVSKALTVTPSVTLAWDASTTTNVIAYRLYQGPASMVYTNAIDVGNVLTYQVTNFARGTTIFYSATALDSNGLESAHSNEVSYSAPTNPAPPLNLVITAQVAYSPSGPWLSFTNFAIANNGSNNFFRLQISSAP